METVKITERGWAGHFIASNYCKFRRNTLIEFGDTKIVVSTIGNYNVDGKTSELGYERFYETMAFHAKFDGTYWDADVTKEYPFETNWAIPYIKEQTDKEANEMHENIVKEIINNIKQNGK